MKKFLPLLLLLAVFLALDASESNRPDNKLFVSSLSVSVREEHTEYTFIMLKPEDEEVSQSFATVSASDLQTALNSLEKAEGKEPVLSMLECVVMSESLSSAQTRSLLGELLQEPSVTPKVSFYFASAEAQTYIIDNKSDPSQIAKLAQKPSDIVSVYNSQSVDNILVTQGNTIISKPGTRDISGG